MLKLPLTFTLSLGLTLFPARAAESIPEFKGTIERLDPALDALIAKDAKIEVLASGFNWSEGPVWHDGKIVFSDVPENVAYAWKEGDKEASVFLKPSGVTGIGQGSNGLTEDAEGRLVLCQQEEHRIARREKDGSFTSLADRWEGKRFNSPNDLVIDRGGNIYFTDPTYGMRKEVKPVLDFHGVFRIDKSGKVTAVIKDLRWPNGVALSPEEKTLYIAVSDAQDTRIMAYDLSADGTVTNGRVFFDANPLKLRGLKGLCDGLKVDVAGNVWTTGPGGVLVLSKEGKHIGSILTGVNTGNCAWGDAARRTLYITADMFLLRVKTKIKGI